MGQLGSQLTDHEVLYLPVFLLICP